MGNGNRKPKKNRTRKEPTVSTQPQTPVPDDMARTAPQDPSVVVASLLSETDGWYVQLKRSLAAYNSLRLSLASSKGQLAPGERAKGLPVFEFSAPLIGAETREAVKCALDLRKVNPEHLGHVLIPLMNAQAADLLEAVGEIEERLTMIKPLLNILTGAAPAA